jgi:hypothetical protein
MHAILAWIGVQALVIVELEAGMSEEHQRELTR